MRLYKNNRLMRLHLISLWLAELSSEPVILKQHLASWVLQAPQYIRQTRSHRQNAVFVVCSEHNIWYNCMFTAQHYKHTSRIYMSSSCYLRWFLVGSARENKYPEKSADDEDLKEI